MSRGIENERSDGTATVRLMSPSQRARNGAPTGPTRSDSGNTVSSASPETDALLCLGLAFVGGYGDAAGVLVAKTFTGHVTGNLVLVAIDVISMDGKAVLGHLLATVSFLSGVFLSILMARRLNSRSLGNVLAIEIALLCTASLAMASHVVRSINLFLFCVALALGLQNGAIRQVAGVNVHTTFLTGMIASLITSETDRFFPSSPHRLDSVHNSEPNLLARIWIAFMLGAGIGGAVILRFGGFGIVGAALLLLGLLFGSVVRFPSLRKI